ncbi:DNA adenine methylase [Ralstonia solanacearum]|uniref:DNA adenine methylase n=1 Tax=Ralstonia solanacearum TaxID=305 RepID=UPI0018D01D57|nr:DNA adenine methylase [Ralstonia solanacearum]
MSSFFTPLRYPGGKGKLADFLRELFRSNNLIGGEYVEPYAGGAGVAMELLILEYVSRVHINDINPAVWAFWHAVISDTDHLCRLIQDTPVTIAEWHKQRAIQAAPDDYSTTEFGFSTFFLNRCNRSGILTAGVIGGLQQDGKWKLDARYNKDNLIKRIELIARHKDQISLTRQDAAKFLKKLAPRLPKNSLIYLDPPYYVKGGDLYEHHYTADDHGAIAELIRKLGAPFWMVSYDDVPEIRALYPKLPHLRYTLSYTAQARTRGNEIIFFHPDLRVPDLQGSMRAA